MEYIAQRLEKSQRRVKVDWIKRISAPKYYLLQKEEKAKKAAGILRRAFFPSSGSTDIVMDDESYICLKDDIPQEMLVSTRNL